MIATLVAATLLLRGELTSVSRIQDCIMSGRTNGAPIEGDQPQVFVILPGYVFTLNALSSPVTVGYRSAFRYALKESGERNNAVETLAKAGDTSMSDTGKPAPEGDHARERMEEFLRKRMPQRDTPAPDHDGKPTGEKPDEGETKKP